MSARRRRPASPSSSVRDAPAPGDSAVASTAPAVRCPESGTPLGRLVARVNAVCVAGVVFCGTAMAVDVAARAAPLGGWCALARPVAATLDTWMSSPLLINGLAEVCTGGDRPATSTGCAVLALGTAWLLLRVWWCLPERITRGWVRCRCGHCDGGGQSCGALVAEGNREVRTLVVFGSGEDRVEPRDPAHVSWQLLRSAFCQVATHPRWSASCGGFQSSVRSGSTCAPSQT